MNRLGGRNDAAAEQGWEEFVADPIARIDIDRLGECLGGELGEELCSQLLGNGRLRARLNTLVQDQYSIPAVPEDAGLAPADKAIALASPATLQQLVLFAGAIYWSGAIANTVRASEVAALRAQIGDELSAFALKHRDLAGPEKSIGSFDDIADRVIESGWHCLNIWCASQHPAVDARVRLKLPPNAFPASAAIADFQDIGPAIIRRAAAEVI